MSCLLNSLESKEFDANRTESDKLETDSQLLNLFRINAFQSECDHQILMDEPFSVLIWPISQMIGVQLLC